MALARRRTDLLLSNPMLQAAGLPVGMPSAAWILQRSEEITRLHRVYVEAGSQIIRTSTFG